MTDPKHGMAASSIEESITMLERYLPAEELGPLVGVLRELVAKPSDGALLVRLSGEIDRLGILQGAVLTYAPAVAGLLSDDPFGD